MFQRAKRHRLVRFARSDRFFVFQRAKRHRLVRFARSDRWNRPPALHRGSFIPDTNPRTDSFTCRYAYTRSPCTRPHLVVS